MCDGKSFRLCLSAEYVRHHVVDDFDSQQSLDEGIIQAIWITREQLLERQQQLRSPMVLRCIDDYLANNRYPLSLLTDM